MKKIVLIHGSEWKMEDISDSISDCKKSTWEKKNWQPRPALISRAGGKSTLYLGQKYDPGKTDLIPDGWNHDHCQICW